MIYEMQLAYLAIAAQTKF